MSKLKPAADILALHNKPDEGAAAGPRHRDFGENYAQELMEKAKRLPRSIRWHMIGALQTNKCKPLAESVPNLWCVSSVDSTKKADALDKGRKALLEQQKQSGANPQAESANAEDSEMSIGPLRVLVQVNTSGEENKSGVAPGADAIALCRHIREQTPNLRLAGLMTIGAIARSQAATGPDGENEDFVSLVRAREEIAEALKIPVTDLALSMGMSADFQAAIAQGSDEVRVGTTIFGQRPPRNEAKVV